MLTLVCIVGRAFAFGLGFVGRGGATGRFFTPSTEGEDGSVLGFGAGGFLGEGVGRGFRFDAGVLSAFKHVELPD